MRNIRFPIFLLTGCVFLLMFHSCSRCSRQHATDNSDIDLADWAIDSNYVDMARKVFYALPTPIEMSMLIKSQGIDYQHAMLNDPANASKYLTNRKMALNFGVYVTDLAYAGLFEQSQTVLHYKGAIQHLGEELGLRSAIDQKTVQTLEENINDKDEVLRIISDIYASCTATLNENDRNFLTLAMIVGGWVEGMYISTGTIDENLLLHESKMKQLVVNQILTFDMIWQVMSEVKNNPDVAAMMSDLSELAQLYDRICVNNSANDVTVAPDGKSSIISSSNFDNVTPELFAKIKSQIQTLHHIITKI